MSMVCSHSFFISFLIMDQMIFFISNLSVHSQLFSYILSLSLSFNVYISIPLSLLLPILSFLIFRVTFLRNHDELTLEMVTEEEREFMWSVYAKDPRMKSNLGVC